MQKNKQKRKYQKTNIQAVDLKDYNKQYYLLRERYIKKRHNKNPIKSKQEKKPVKIIYGSLIVEL